MTDTIDRTAHIDEIDAQLRALFAVERVRATAYGEHYTALWETLEQASSGGKRIRPTLVRLAYFALGGRNTGAVDQVAVAFELLHTAFVIHDDVIDHDTRRRGQPNIAGAFADRGRRLGVDEAGSDAWGEAAAVLAGDLALSLSHRTIARLDVGADIRLPLLDILDRSVFVSAAGELADVAYAILGDRPVIDRVLSTLEQKTAVYSVEAPLQAGAVLAGADTRQIEALGRFGRLAGVAFQLADDILGVFGEENELGKSTIADLREGKRTALMAFAATTDAWARIEPLLGSASLDEAGADEIRAALRESGALSATVELAREHVTLAVFEIESSDLPRDLVSALTDFARSAVERTR
ncbi:polyprenyl synthetase family protein [Agromyces atrinae]|uniref:Geranylgeranyl diphosphate synthase type II n=1 Tax=Agromyces atrinae TaxID=592376 RepID=A0A4V1R283_9MICO|nr:polyprenyl synthetase family protein [Agromyces atrinae]NYD65918.1 geranylgeranyl diphosphate synthase type II [Agromyces atrinae]RXZ86256.1 polyprenyl synthetase family protein [Agromyces atrinae]